MESWEVWFHGTDMSIDKADKGQSCMQWLAPDLDGLDADKPLALQIKNLVHCKKHAEQVVLNDIQQILICCLLTDEYRT